MIRLTLCCAFYFLHCTASVAQPSRYVSYTTKDGLPSNLIYRCLEDDKGFLWVATDAGIARFDGKQFQVFTTDNGLPDNEVLSVVKEKDGRIWVNCFKQGPSYFDEVRNRFISGAEDPDLARVTGTSIMALFTLENGGVMYYNGNRGFIFKEKRLVADASSRNDLPFQVKEFADGSTLSMGIVPLLPGGASTQNKLVHHRGDQTIDSVLLGKMTKGYVPASINGGALFIFADRVCYVHRNFLVSPLRFQVDSFTVPELIANTSFTNTSVYILTVTGKIFVYNKRTLQYQGMVQGDYLANSFFNDSKGNFWISTIDKGVLVYRQNAFRRIELPVSFSHDNFISVARRPDGVLLAGNYYGEVIEWNRGRLSVHNVSKKIPSRQRKVLVSGTKVYSFSEDGIMVDYKRPVLQPVNNYHIVAKAAIPYDDSTIMIGTFSGLARLNTKTDKVTILNTGSKRVTSLARVSNGDLYFGSTDGLYKYDCADGSVISLSAGKALLSERITTLAATADDILWIGTAAKGMITLKDDRILTNIDRAGGIINNACRSITAGRPGQVWLGTEQGISLIRYSLTNGTINYAVQNTLVNNSSGNKGINEIIYEADSIYAVTADGIYVLPANSVIAPYEIPVYMISMTINQRDTIIAESYSLSSGRKDILIRFGAVELNGNFKNLEYALDDTKLWTPLQDNSLNLQLNYGHHDLHVRAVDVNGNIGKDVLLTRFDIATPFWKTLWFWISAIVLLQAVALYGGLLWKREKRKSKLARQVAIVQNASLEQQAFTSLMNPHFMFNALNSIQHYINVQDRQNANRYLSDFASLIRKNFEAAQKSFISLEEELENLRIYLRLEQMRFKDRLTYEINIASQIDTEQWMIPTMILQPLLENAVLHGLMPSPLPGRLCIELEEKGSDLHITITDSGIGLKRSLLSKTAGAHKSHGMDLIEKRMSALSRFVPEPITVTMAPAFESELNPGNRIEIVIPAGLYDAWNDVQKLR